MRHWMTAGGGLVLALLSAVGGAGAAAAQTQPARELIERVGFGEINWTTGWIKAKGVGSPPANATGDRGLALAERAGYLVALRNLLEIVNGVRVDAEATTDRYVDKSEVIRTRISGFVRGAQVIKTQELPDKSVEVLIKMPLWGSESLISAFLSEKNVPSLGLPPESDDGQSVTGFVIDARGLGVKPACFPIILDENGAVVYGPQQVDRAAVEKDGMAAYRALPAKADLSSVFGEDAFVIRPIQQVASGPREGRRPLKLKGLGKAGSLQANIMISSEDAKRLRDDARVGRALKRGKVVIVTDPLIGGMEGRGPVDRGLVAALPGLGPR